MGDPVPREIVNLSEMEPRFNWFATSRFSAPLHWMHATCMGVQVPAWVPRPMTWRRLIAAFRAAAMLHQPEAVLVSHGPRPGMWGALALALSGKAGRRHLLYSFNFTELPHGALRRLMATAFRSVDRFVCFSTMERSLYARHFGLDIERIDMLHWAADPPAIDPVAPPLITGRYACAMGSQGRDYATLAEAMRRLPDVRLVLVANRASVAGLTLPANIELRCDIPLAQAMNILQHAAFSVVPLRDSEVPCGHVTIVSAMHAGKATIVTASSGVADYVEDGATGLTVPPRDAQALAAAIERLWDDAEQTSRLAAAGLAFAQRHCSPRSAIDYFDDYLRRSRPTGS